MSQTWEEWLIHQRVLYRLEKWNHMKFKKESKILNLGRNSPMHYILGEYTLLEGSLSEKNLCVLVGTKLRSSQHCVLAAKKANGVPRGIRQRAACWVREVILLLCVRPW